MSWLGRVVERQKAEQELDAELRFDYDQRVAEKVREGMNEAEARRATRLEFGGLEQVKEQCRDANSFQWLTWLLRDARLAIRMMRRNRGFTIAAIVTLALGIGANTAVFSVFNGLFLNALPYVDANRLVYLGESEPARSMEIALPDYTIWRSANQTFSGMALYQENGASLSGFGDPVRIKSATVSWNMGAVLGIKPLLGRDFLPAEDRPRNGAVVLLSYDLWRRRFNGDAAAIGKIIQLDDFPFRIVGVLPSNAVFPDADVWAPYAVDPNLDEYLLEGIGRLKGGVTLDQARADLLRAHRLIARARPVNNRTWPTIIPLRDHYLGDYRPVSEALLVAVGLVLLIACVNIASLMLARNSARRGESAIRSSLGAGRRRLMAQILTETLLLTVAGAAGGFGLGWAALRALIALMPDVLPPWVEFHLDFRLLLFAVIVAALVAMLAGMGPAWEFSSQDTSGALGETAKNVSASMARRRGLNILVASEIALAFVLLVSGGLALKAFRRVVTTEPGFNTHNVFTFKVNPPYPKSEERLRIYDQLLAGLKATPGVDLVGAGSPPVPDRMGGGFFLDIDGASVSAAARQVPVRAGLAAPGYFRALGIPFVAGRDFDVRNGSAEQGSIIVNEAFVRNYWPADTNVIGLRVTPRTPLKPIPHWTIVGVVRDSRINGLERESYPQEWLYYDRPPYTPYLLTLVVRSRIGPATLLPAARNILLKADPGLALFEARTLDDLVDRSIRVRRTWSWLFGIFAAIAVAIALAGIYGVISYSVAQRNREIAIRTALGARPAQILGMVMRHGMAAVLIGAAAGTALSFAAPRLMGKFLSGVGSLDPIILIAVMFAIASAAGVAIYIPARHGSQIDPMPALKYE